MIQIWQIALYPILFLMLIKIDIIVKVKLLIIVKCMFSALKWWVHDWDTFPIKMDCSENELISQIKDQGTNPQIVPIISNPKVAELVFPVVMHLRTL